MKQRYLVLFLLYASPFFTFAGYSVLNEPKHYIYYDWMYHEEARIWGPNYNNAKITTDRAEWLSVPAAQREQNFMFTRPVFAFGIILELGWILLVTVFVPEKMLEIEEVKK